MSAAEEMVRLPADVIAGVDEFVGMEQRDGFVAEAVARAVQSEQNRRAIRKCCLRKVPSGKRRIIRNLPEVSLSMCTRCATKKESCEIRRLRTPGIVIDDSAR